MVETFVRNFEVNTECIVSKNLKCINYGYLTYSIVLTKVYTVDSFRQGVISFVFWKCAEKSFSIEDSSLEATVKK